MSTDVEVDELLLSEDFLGRLFPLPSPAVTNMANWRFSLSRSLITDDEDD